MKEKLPINRSILIWARESSGLTIDELALKLKQNRDTIIEWEKGISSPTYPVLEKMAYDIFKRPVALFFFPDLPYEDNINTTFRTIPGMDIQSLPREINLLIRKAAVMQMNLYELYEGNFQTSSIIKKIKIDLDTNIDLVARKTREMFGISIDEQMSWKNPEHAVKEWRSVFEKNGITVFKDAFKNKEFSGFCLFDEDQPIIYVNNSMSFARQVFTLFHELAHLLLQSSGIDYSKNAIVNEYTGEYKRYEVVCNHFAGEFLVPDSVFNKIPMEINEEYFDHYSSLFSVSREVILRKCFDRELCDEYTYRHFAEKWNEERKSLKEKKEGDGGNYYNNIISYLGERYIVDSFKALYQKRIDYDKLSSFLNISVKNTIELEKRVLG